MLWLNTLQDTWMLWIKGGDKRFARLIRTLKKCQKERRMLPLPVETLPGQEQKLIQQIQEKTQVLNRNNVTRTMAYYDFYRDHPEIHWALLAHLVSRNAGWNMTDLAGEWLPRLLTAEQCRDFFLFLERGNWLIFHDAYPQLLLYEEGKNRNQNISYLLPYLGVSAFIKSVWDEFWKSHDLQLLAVALIVNEQSYLEARVIQNPRYRQNVLQTLDYVLQDILGLNHILFPRQASDIINTQEACPLVGCSVHHFDLLRKRILLGKQLYAMLFGQPTVLNDVLRWAEAHPHTGSRSDYWPHLFGTVQEWLPNTPYIPHLNKNKLKPGVPRLYSPSLVQAWPDTIQDAAEPGDWFRDWRMVSYLLAPCKAKSEEMMTPYCDGLEKVELAVLGKQTLFSL
ncbi:DUF2515 family protein [Aneurinibacillus migulanus]|uniref:DUF2515 domain-containing protein n=2 Tax=Aneurinibacillus migulanus TaxID=47500 RepID=A0A1G8U6F2_ANEMI|nr:DUF2515 family protein [Aneurinibacillus migulanus]MED0895037.1 DUF2515 family protein [Aneurinibacillus migulanus]MED1617977.1 DUF2515 family protein [Aneurinibacillus migulanus]GED15240.1 hypothetical protein AMI01nite_32310 [Aneurinibacillus migulanus]SDJ49368.1 Protein of unknown function [Aneurinibacillus migulanus]